MPGEFKKIKKKHEKGFVSSIVAIIPARMASSRFPGKPLKPILGLSMIEHVRRRVSLCDFLEDVFVATCDREIAGEVERFGGKVVMTSDRHESCVDRVAEAAKNIDAEIIINVQGDMPLVQPAALKQLITPLLENDTLMFTDMMRIIEDSSEINNSNVVKVVFDTLQNALYYSREPIPSPKKVSIRSSVTSYKQLGINAFRKESLMAFTGLPRTSLEKIESVDMLRLLENRLTVRMVAASFPSTGVDTIEDLKRAEDFMRKDSLCLSYTDKYKERK